MSGIGRRAFVRASALAFAAACTPQRPRPPTTATSPPTSKTPQASQGYSWRQIDTSGPRARRDHSFTGAGPSAAYMFAGRAAGQPLDDLWRFDGARQRWSKIDASGPAARFGHSAEWDGETLYVFGGQGVGDEFFDDLWSFRPDRGWRELPRRGDVPAARYGAGNAFARGHMVVSHGFTSRGRFDDTFRFDGNTWVDITPDGARPVKRCLHRCAFMVNQSSVLLFGGQTNDDPYLDDTWVLDLQRKRWRRVDTAGPSGRTLYAVATTPHVGDGVAVVFGGLGEKGPLDDTWVFDGARWEQVRTAATPPARGGTEGATLGGRSMLVFGGDDGDRELDDLWELRFPPS